MKRPAPQDVREAFLTRPVRRAPRHTMRDVSAVPSVFEMTNALLAMTGHRHAQIVGDTDRDPFDGDTALELLGSRGDVAVLFVTVDGDVYGVWDKKEETPYTRKRQYPFEGAVLLFNANSTPGDVVSGPTAGHRTAQPVGRLPLALSGPGFIAYRRDSMPLRLQAQARQGHLHAVNLSLDPHDVRPRETVPAGALWPEWNPMTIVIDGVVCGAIDAPLGVVRTRRFAADSLFVAIAHKDIARTLVVRLS